MKHHHKPQDSSLKQLVKGVATGFLLSAALFGHGSAKAQSTLVNPLMRPNTAKVDPATAPLPPGTPTTTRAADGPVQAKSLQEEVTANMQRLNADRVPQPLRILLSTVYVSTIHGDTAVLRQPIPPAQQAVLANSGPGIPGVPGSVPGVPGSIPGMIPGATPGLTPGLPGTGLPVGGAIPGAIPGAPLSAGVGLVNPFAVPPPRPTSIRVRDGKTISLQGFELTARIRDTEVTLLWNHGDERQTIVFQSGIESPSLPAFVPQASTLEKPDTSYFGRVQAGATTGTGGTGGTGGGAGSGSGGGTGAR